MANDKNMQFYTLKYRGTSYYMNIEAKTLKQAKEKFCEIDGISLDAIGRVQVIRKPSFIESMTKVVRATA